MRRRLLVAGLLALALFVSILALACGGVGTTGDVPDGGGSTGEVVELRLANYFGADTLIGQVFQDLCDDLQTRSNGQIKVTYCPGGQLFDGPGTLVGIKNKVADIGFMTTGHYRGVFPVSEAVSSISGYPSAYVVAHVANDFQNEFQPAEWDDYHVLLAAGFSPLVIFSPDAIETMEDLAGTRCRVKGLQADQATVMGATTIDIPMGGLFDAMQKGVLDNAATSLEAAETWGLADICDYCTLSWMAFSPPAYYLVMNGEVWDGLPESAQRVFTEVSDEYVEKVALVCNDADIKGAEYGIEQGMEFITLSDEEMQKWQSAVEPVTEAWAQSMVDAGYSQDEVDGWITYIQERIDYWLQQQADAGIKSPMGPESIYWDK